MTEPNSQRENDRTTKVRRLLAEYEMIGFGERLERYWTGDGESQRSLRELEDMFNRNLLRTVLERNGSTPLDEEVETIYRLLKGENTDDATRLRARRNLEREGVDVDSLERDFISHQAIHTYLTQDRGAEYEGSTADPTESVKETVQSLKNRLRAVTETGIKRLTNGGEISVNAPTVMVDVRVHCDECNRMYNLEELISESGCDCNSA